MADAPEKEARKDTADTARSAKDQIKTDIFQWANGVDTLKDNLKVELFLFNKNYTVYATHFASELNTQLKPLFLYEMLNYITMGAAMGLSVRRFEETLNEENVLPVARLGDVQHAQEVIEQMSYGNELEVFSEDEHEFKRIKGVVAKFTHSALAAPFFIIKVLPQGQILKKGPTSWAFVDGEFRAFTLDAGLKITPDNQVMVTGQDIFIFNEAKFTKLFGYDIKLQSLADKQIAALEKQFQLVYPEGQNAQNMISNKKTVLAKLQKLDLELVTQDQLMDHANEMEVDLMSDDNGRIIIMDEKDMTRFVDLLNDDYMTSPMTGIKYLVKGKKRID